MLKVETSPWGKSSVIFTFDKHKISTYALLRLPNRSGFNFIIISFDLTMKLPFSFQVSQELVRHQANRKKKYTSRTREFKIQQSNYLDSDGGWWFFSPLENRWKPKWKERTQNHWEHVGVHWAASRQFWTQAVQQSVPRTPQKVFLDALDCYQQLSLHNQDLWNRNRNQFILFHEVYCQERPSANFKGNLYQCISFNWIKEIRRGHIILKCSILGYWSIWRWEEYFVIKGIDGKWVIPELGLRPLSKIDFAKGFLFF